MSEHEARLADIRRNLERMQVIQDHPTHGTTVSPKAYAKDVSYLLSRVEALEEAIQEYERYLKRDAERIGALEQENERLRLHNEDLIDRNAILRGELHQKQAHVDELLEGV